MARVQSLVLKKRLLAFSVILARYEALKVVRQVGRPLSLHEISHCQLFLLCSLLS